MDCSIIESKKYEGMFLVSTTDFFYPLVEDPYQQGRIACANVLSDMYSLGISDIDTVLMILAASNEMPANAADITTQQIMKGFNDLCIESGTRCTGGQTVLNPWPIIGGVAESICKKNDFIDPMLGQPGDKVVLTKPIGTQPAVNAQEWRHSDPVLLERARAILPDDELLRAFNVSAASMARTNRTGAALMHKYGAHGCTDVTGFGIMGHAENLVWNHKHGIELVFDRMPVVRGMWELGREFPVFNLHAGYSAETSGGLLVLLPADKAEDFCAEISEIDGWPAYVVGEVLDAPAGQSSATIVPNIDVIDV